MHPILNIAIRIAVQGGNKIIQAYDKKIYDNKKNKKILIQIINKSKNIIFNLIKKSYPKHKIIINNSLISLKKFINPTWVINILHGKKNFIKRFPNFCISIAIFIKKKICISVIYDPLKNELFTSVSGKGSQVNGYRMRSSKNYLLKNSFFSTKINNVFINKNIIFIKILNKIFKKKVIFRSNNLLPLDLAYLADGRIDFILDFNFKIKNYYSGLLQVQESGGVISDYLGGCNYEKNIVIIANNLKLMRLIISEINSIF
ncbi:MAG: inositol monophosphatase [Buchnera aphidicola (Periphyllus lyropictus)]|uniref:inositol monophosphatase family protein n=1 Tax=Buchnera aphidicola TaxID=9 RepID=UPI001EC730D8|nr:inositol monophosphatase family protein [Buchnera aphidicola]NIH16607.1 inositol monophosphatase [Buchnera aphidicola (Periphyllus lyropictus)]USS94520.1 inositol monophosphatase [Buchnera aphidicola (Periphyllus lyropictus)]